jgi:starvation-inducible DNA-binding protein
LADNLALDVKIRKFHWHLSGPQFRDYHLLFDDQASQNLCDHRRDRSARAQLGWPVAEVDLANHPPADDEGDGIATRDIIAELLQDNQSLTAEMKTLPGCVTKLATSQLRACWKTGSTKPTDGLGSF